MASIVVVLGFKEGLFLWVMLSGTCKLLLIFSSNLSDSSYCSRLVAILIWQLTAIAFGFFSLANLSTKVLLNVVFRQVRIGRADSLASFQLIFLIIQIYYIQSGKEMERGEIRCSFSQKQGNNYKYDDNNNSITKQKMQNLTQKQRQILQSYTQKLKQKIMSHDHLKSLYKNLSTSLSEMPESELRNIAKNRYKQIFKQIEPVLQSTDPEVKISCIRDVLHLNCKNQFQVFAWCQFQKQQLKKMNQEFKDSCQKQINQYISCVEGLSSKLVMSSLNMY